MRQLLRILLPYLARHKGIYLLGAIVVTISNWFYVQITVQIGKAVDYILSPAGAFSGVWRFVVAILVFMVIAALCHYFIRIFLIGVSRDIEYQFRNDFFRHLTRLSPSFYDREKTGDIISRATSDIDNIRMALGPGVMYPLNTINIVPMTVYAMLAKNHPLTGYAFIPMIVTPFFVYFFSNMMYKRSLRIRENFSEFSGRIQDSITGIRMIKSYVQSNHELEVLDEYSKKNVELNMSLARLQAAFFPLMIPIFISGVVIIIWLSGSYVVTDPSLVVKGRMMTKGDLIAFVMLYGNLFFPIMGLGWVLSLYQRASASMHRIQLIWKQEPEITDTPETNSSLQPSDIKGTIEFRNLTFTYPHAPAPSLHDISFKLEKGKTLGIVGPVGSGKSTIALLIPRLYNPPAGTILLDGRDIRAFPLGVLRQSVGAVFQETYLFSDTIANNISFGLSSSPDSPVSGADSAETDNRIRQAAQIASVENEILEFPRQYETELGERGINLSGGQKQRVALARALACDPKILILDDAFASIDTHTEDAILSGLRSVMGQRTTILISHRISTVQLADHIIVLDDGRIVEQGAHAQLVALNGLYAGIYQRQLLQQSIEEENSQP